MQKYLIIGNGFDLHHALPTKYEHFINVLKSIEKLDGKPDYTFEEVFCNIPDDYKSRILNSYKTENIVYPDHIIQSIKYKIQNNTWYQCFKHITDIDTWIDFETQIELILKLINTFFKEATLFLTDYKNRGEIFVSCSKIDPKAGFTINSKQLTVLLNLKILDPITRLVYSGKVNSMYLLVEDNYIHSLNERNILMDLSNSLEEFIDIFNHYFIDVIDPFYNNYKYGEPIKNKLGNIVEIKSSLNKKEAYGEEFKTIYSFNYTPTLQKYYKAKRVNYLHGHIGSDQNIVLGVNDINEECKEHKMFAFTKYYQKLYKNTDYYFLENDFITHHKSIIYFWGHSLDQSDGEYINRIFTFLVDRNSTIRIIIYFHDNLARASQLSNLLKIRKKEEVENAIKSGRLEFQKSTNDNLLKMIEFNENTHYGNLINLL